MSSFHWVYTVDRHNLVFIVENELVCLVQLLKLTSLFVMQHDRAKVSDVVVLCKVLEDSKWDAGIMG